MENIRETRTGFVCSIILPYSYNNQTSCMQVMFWCALICWPSERYLKQRLRLFFRTTLSDTHDRHPDGCGIVRAPLPFLGLGFSILPSRSSFSSLSFQRRTCSSLIFRNSVFFCSSFSASRMSGSTYMVARICCSIFECVWGPVQDVEKNKRICLQVKQDAPLRMWLYSFFLFLFLFSEENSYSSWLQLFRLCSFLAPAMTASLCVFSEKDSKREKQEEEKGISFNTGVIWKVSISYFFLLVHLMTGQLS